MKMKTKKIKIAVGGKKQLATFAARIEPDKFRRLDPEFYAEQLNVLVKALRKGRWSLNSGCTSFRPLGGKRWRTGDGGEVEATLIELIIGWFERGWECDITGSEEWIMERFLIAHCGQADYEGRKINGDVF